ncbi:hypothetical protein [Citrobacter braakii]|uniref:hypothetical protein n=1 Tax=Citrobacter braakii TaxID=57706 RepID=UPI00397571A9
MSVLIISRDHFFSFGLTTVLREGGLRVYPMLFKSITDIIKTVFINKVDIIIIDIDSFSDTTFLHRDINKKCHLIYIFDLPLCFLKMNRSFLSKKAPSGYIIKSLQNITEINHPVINSRNMRNLELFNQGHSIQGIADEINMCKKSVYRIKNEVVINSGFLKFHPAFTMYIMIILLQLLP